MKLTFSHQIIERRRFATVTQELFISVDYDPEEDSIGDIEVSIFQDRKFMVEVSKLLDKAEGNPLLAIVEAIDWRQLWAETKAEKAELRAESNRENGY